MNRVRTSGRFLSASLATAAAALGPWLDLLIRLWLAQAFLVVQVTEMMLGAGPAGLDAPLGTAWWYGALHGVMASSLGLVVQTACPVLLALGLLARPAALAMLVQALVFSGMGAGPDAQVFWTALLLRVVLLGPGALSLDSLLRRGADSVAIPGAATARHAFAWLRRTGGPAYQVGLRLWLAAAPAGVALAALNVTQAMQSGPRLLPAFPEALSNDAAMALRRLGVDVVLDSKVEAVAAEGVTVSGQAIPARTVLWAAGVMASPAAAWLGVTPDRAGRVPVGPDLQVPGLDGVFAIGDTAASTAWAGQAVPGLAPAAKQGGAYVARVIRARLAERRAPGPFHYRHLGSLATIGRQSAVADFGVIRVRGAVAWWLWGAVHIAFLAGGRNRATVLVEWLWAYLTFRRGTRLITGG